LAIGGVAPIPLRLSAVEDLLVGSSLDDDAVSAAAAAATAGAKPLPETGYKVQLIEASVREALERVRS
jgi:xanthine dehydrogenase YagS FAD-binding subunit